jgi:signal transduction histidine kinase
MPSARPSPVAPPAWGAGSVARRAAAACLAVGLPLATVGAVRLVGPTLDPSVYMLLLAAVVVSAYAGGLWVGLLATTSAVALANYYYVPPEGGAIPVFTTDRVHLALFATLGALLAALAHALRWARRVAQSRAAALARLNEELAAAARAAEGANHSKGRFLATVSHELRTPLAAVTGYAQLLDEEIDGPLTPRQRAYVGGIRTAGAHLQRLVDDVLDLERIDAGQLVLRPSAGRVADVVREAVDLVRPQALARRIALGAEGAEAATYFADAGRVRQILVNLLANAVKFTPEEGTVSVAYRAAARPDAGAATGAGQAVVTVRDSGPGIARDELERVFEPFVQLGSDGKARALGAGLGLTIGRRLARLMRGDLAVDSAPGDGATFTLVLPATPGPAGAALDPA